MKSESVTIQMKATEQYLFIYTVLSCGAVYYAVRGVSYVWARE